jgi:hypothetical protein
VPVLVRATGWLELVVPTAVFGKVMVAGDTLAVGRPPLPIRLTTRVPLLALLGIDRTPEADPVVVGVNRTWMLHSAPDASVIPAQPSVRWKGPVIVLVEGTIGPAPRLRSVTVRSLLVWPTFTVPKSRLVSATA